MEKRGIVTLMHRLWPGPSLPTSDEWRHLFVDDKLDRTRFDALLDEYIDDEEVLIYRDSQTAMSCKRIDAFAKVAELLPRGPVKLADVRFNGRVFVHSMGVGAGHRVGQ